MTKMTLKQRFAVAAAIGVAGGVVATAITLAGGAMFHEWGFVRVATAGAFLSGLLVAPGFGGTGPGGWFRSGLCFGAATVLGAMFAVMLLPFEEFLMRATWIPDLLEFAGVSVIGPVYVAGMIGENATILAGWISAHALIQAMTLALRR